MGRETTSVTELLGLWNEGDAQARDDLMPQINSELRRVAAKFLHGERRNHTLQPTALVNEVYLRLLEKHRVKWRDRNHFVSFAARMMRFILVDHARSQRADKRGGGESPEPLSVVDVCFEEGDCAQDIDLLMLNDALEKLMRLNSQQGRVVELRYFAGMTVDEVADSMGVGRSTVVRYWALAKAFLFRELSRP